MIKICKQLDFTNAKFKRYKIQNQTQSKFYEQQILFAFLIQKKI